MRPPLFPNPHLGLQYLKGALDDANRQGTSYTYGQTVRMGHPLSEAQPLMPIKPEYCPTCKIDVLSNPDAKVTALVRPVQGTGSGIAVQVATVHTSSTTGTPLPVTDEDSTYEVTCDCGGLVQVPCYLYT